MKLRGEEVSSSSKTVCEDGSTQVHILKIMLWLFFFHDGDSWRQVDPERW